MTKANDTRSKTIKPDFDSDQLLWLSWGLIFRTVCAPKSWTPERVAKEVTKKDPPGTSLNEWVISEPDPDRDDDFKGVNVLPCPNREDRQHWLLNC